MFADPNTPNLPDFITFVRNQGVTAAMLPDASDFFNWAFVQARDITLHVPQIPSILYVMAVYNYGMNWLINWAQDTPPSTFFTDYRKANGILAFTAGPVSATADQGTSSSFATPDWVKDATLSTLGLLKTPWGRAYLEYAQQWGPTVVGVS